MPQVPGGLMPFVPSPFKGSEEQVGIARPLPPALPTQLQACSRGGHLPFPVCSAQLALGVAWFGAEAAGQESWKAKGWSLFEVPRSW